MHHHWLCMSDSKKSNPGVLFVKFKIWKIINLMVLVPVNSSKVARLMLKVDMDLELLL